MYRLGKPAGLRRFGEPPRRRVGVLAFVVAAHIFVVSYLSLPHLSRRIPEFQAGSSLLVNLDLGSKGDEPMAASWTLEEHAIEVDLPTLVIAIEGEPEISTAGVTYTDAPQRTRQDAAAPDPCLLVQLEVARATTYDKGLAQRLEHCQQGRRIL